jgi:hypothetical protein
MRSSLLRLIEWSAFSRKQGRIGSIIQRLSKWWAELAITDVKSLANVSDVRHFFKPAFEGWPSIGKLLWME